MDGFTYKDGAVLDYVGTPEGRALRKPDNSFEYEYSYEDHLGSTRLLWKVVGGTGYVTAGVNYFGGEYSQTSGYIGGGADRFSVMFENDFFTNPKSDKYRTAAMDFRYQLNEDLAINGGFKIFTGETAGEEIPMHRSERPRLRKGTVTAGGNEVSNGVLYGGISIGRSSSEFGWDSEGIRDNIQNRFHNWLNFAHILPNPTRLARAYNYFGRRGLNSLY